MPFVSYDHFPATIRGILGEEAEVAWDRDIPGDYLWFHNHISYDYCDKDCTGTELRIYSKISNHPWKHIEMITDGHGQSWLWDGKGWWEWS